MRITSTSCTRNSSSNASLRRAVSLSLIVSGRWIISNAIAAIDETEPAADVVGNRIGDAAVVATAQRLLDPTGQLPRVQLGLLALRVDRDDATGAIADQVDDRVRHLQHAAVRVDLAEQRDLQTFTQLLLAPRLVEEHDVHATRAVTDLDVDDRAPVAGRPLRHGAHRHQHERLVTGNEVGDAGLVGPVDPASRVRGDQIEHGVDVERRQRGALLVADALELADVDRGEIAQA